MAKIAATSDPVPKAVFADTEPTTEKRKPSQDGVELKKELGLLDGVAIIVGVIVGSGIFVSPKGVLIFSGSIGQALIVWILSGVLSMVGALCYAELGKINVLIKIYLLHTCRRLLNDSIKILKGTMIPKSGGDYAYIGVAFGPLPAFLYLWVALLILVPTGNAITALTFAQYILQPYFQSCEPPYGAVRFLAALITCNY